MNSVQELILLFTKYPRPGSSKTRLIPALGPAKAADLQLFMTRSMCGKLKTLATKRPCHVHISFTGASKKEMQNLLGEDFIYQRQQGADLGQRMAEAISRHLGRYRAIILVGADCPAVNDTVLLDGLEKLRNTQAIIGPAFDGGYYLIGVQGNIGETDLQYIFTDISWGSANVCHQTIERLTALQMRYELLKKLHDIDTPDDLTYLNHHPGTE